MVGPKGVGGWGLGRVRTQEGWVRPCPNPRGVGICVCALTQGDWVCVRTQGGWALGPSMSGPNRFGVWGLGPFVSGPRGFGSFCIRTQGGWCLGPSVARPKRFGLGRLTQQKGVHVRTQCASQQTRWPGWAAKLVGLAPAPGHESRSVRCPQPEAQPLPPAALELVVGGHYYPCARCLCLGLQHIMPLPNVQSAMQWVLLNNDCF
jgi:hypothetical protein